MANDSVNEKKAEKLEAKREAALEKKEELSNQIEELRVKILEEKDEKEKEKLRKEKDALTEQRNGIVITDDKIKVPMLKKTRKRIQACVAIVLVVALIFTYVATGLAKHGFISTLGYPQRTFTGLVLTDSNGKKHNIKAATYNYYYANAYNTLKQQQSYLSQLSGLGSSASSDSSSDNIDFEKPLSEQETTDENNKKTTWDKKLKQQVLDSIKETYALYYAAVEANDGKEPEITEEQQQEIDDTLKQIKENADKAKYTLDAYIPLAIGYGVNSEVLKTEEKIKYIATNYQSNYEYTDTEYDKYLKEHKDELTGVDVYYFEAESEDDAKDFIKALKSDGSNFAELASKYSSEDWDKTANKDIKNETFINITKANFKAMGGAIGTADEKADEKDDTASEKFSGLDWLYSNKRKAGDVKNFSTSVVYVLKPAYFYKGNTVNVRHILIQPEGEEEGEDGEKTTTSINLSEASSKQVKAAKAKADKVYAEYKKGKKTADAFGALAAKYSSDGNAASGGLYEDVYTNQMVPTFNNWCFDTSRKEGDTAIITTEYGYHIVYFEKTTDTPVWHKLADNALSSDDAETSLSNITEKAEIKVSFLGSRYFQSDLDIQ